MSSCSKPYYTFLIRTATDFWAEGECSQIFWGFQPQVFLKRSYFLRLGQYYLPLSKYSIVECFLIRFTSVLGTFVYPHVFSRSRHLTMLYEH